MPLLCELGWHRADPLARWNAGYYFTSCERCGQDLVRTAYGGWRVPRGYRVVWQAKAPDYARAAELVPDGSLDRAPIDQMELPIQELLRQLESERSEAPPLSEESAEPPFEEPVESEVPIEPEEPIEDEQPVEAEEPVGELVSADGDMGPPLLEEIPPPPPSPRPRPRPRKPEVDPLRDDDWFLAEEPDGSAWDEFVGDYERERGLRPVEEDGSESTSEAEGPETAAQDVIEDDERERIGNRSGKMRFGREVAQVVSSGAALFGRFRRRAGDPGDSLIERAAESAPEIDDESQPRLPLAMADEGAEEPADENVAEEAEAEEKKNERPDWARDRVAITAAASFGVLMVVMAVVAGSARGPSKLATPLPPEGGRTSISQPLETGFVTASLLNCRTSPTEHARSVRRLPRGEPVEILALEPAWASISHRGRQCWASTRYISAERPL